MGSTAYDEYIRGDRREPFELVVAAVDPIDVRARLASAGLAVADRADEFVVRGDGAPGGSWVVSACWSAPAFEIPKGEDLTTAEQEIAGAATYRVSLRCTLARDWSAESAQLVSLAHELFPEMALVADEDGYAFWSPRWAAAVAAGRPVRMTELFKVHLVGHEGEIWAHTHGLRRLGIIELEAFDNEGDWRFAHELVNATAAVMATNGVSPPGVGLRVREQTVVEWSPWDQYEWSEGELGGLEDRDEAHSGASGVIGPSHAEASLGPGLEFDEEGWAVSLLTPRFETIARQTVVEAWGHTQTRDSRSMWLVSGEVDGAVRGLEDGVFTVRNSADETRHLVPVDEVESWGVATESGFCLGPWVAHKVPVIEDVEARWPNSHDDDGTLLCSECGKPLDEVHSHQAT